MLLFSLLFSFAVQASPNLKTYKTGALSDFAVVDDSRYVFVVGENPTPAAPIAVPTNWFYRLNLETGEILQAPVPSITISNLVPVMNVNRQGTFAVLALASVDDDQPTYEYLWDIEKNSLMLLDTSTEYVTFNEFSLDGRHLYHVTYDPALKFTYFDLATGIEKPVINPSHPDTWTIDYIHYLPGTNDIAFQGVMDPGIGHPGSPEQTIFRFNPDQGLVDAEYFGSGFPYGEYQFFGSGYHLLYFYSQASGKKIRDLKTGQDLDISTYDRPYQFVANDWMFLPNPSTRVCSFANFRNGKRIDVAADKKYVLRQGFYPVDDKRVAMDQVDISRDGNGGLKVYSTDDFHELLAIDYEQFPGVHTGFTQVLPRQNKVVVAQELTSGPFNQGAEVSAFDLSTGARTLLATLSGVFDQYSTLPRCRVSQTETHIVCWDHDANDRYTLSRIQF